MTASNPFRDWLVGSLGNSEMSSFRPTGPMYNYPDPIHQLDDELVTWNPNEGAPYNSESYVLGEVSGAPYSAYNSNGALCYWDNEFS